MKKLIWMGLFFLIILSMQTYSTDGLSSCTLMGNHYKCTGAIDANDFFGENYHIYIYKATISYTGANGGTGEAGGNGTIKITSNGKIKIENSTFASTGGNGGAGSSVSFPPGGRGGDSGLSISASNILINNASLTAVSGNGGSGDADPDTSSAEGGVGGTSQITISSDILNYTTGTISLTGGVAGSPDASASAVSCDDSADASSDSTAGAAGGDTSVQIMAKEHYITNVTVDANGGAASSAQAYSTSCTNDPPGSTTTDCATSCSAERGGIGGTLTLFINGSYSSLNNFDLDIDEGLSGLSKSSCEAAAINGDDCSECMSDDGQAGGTTSLTFNTTTLYYTGDINVVGSNGNDADASCAEAGDIPGADLTASNGGNGGDVYLYIDMVNGSVDGLTTSFSGGDGGVDEGADVDYDFNVDGSAGNGGNIYTYVYNATIINSHINSTGGDGHVSNGVGGSSGFLYMYFYDNSVINSTIWRYISGTAQIGGSGDQYYYQGAGTGGTVYWYNYGTTTLYADDFMLTGGTSPSHPGDCEQRGGGGDIVLYNYGSLNIYNNTELNMTGGVATTCGEDGDTYIERSVGSFNLKDSTLTQRPASTEGDCENNFNGTFSIQNSLFFCNTPGTATIRGSNVTQVDYKNYSVINTNGTTANIIWKFSGVNSIDKFLTWNSTFNATTINWNNESDSCKYSNRTPSSIGVVTFNASCNTFGYDAYYTEVNTPKQIWNYSGVVKPFPYSYLDYFCNVTAYLPDDPQGTITASFKWYNSSTAKDEYSQNNTILTSEISYVSSSFVPNDIINVGENWTCKVNVSSTSGGDITMVYNDTIVVPAYHYNLKIDIGNDGVIDYNGTGIFNTTLVTTLVKDGLNEVLKSCNDVNCGIPIKIYSDEDATIGFNIVNSSYGVTTPINGSFNFTLSAFSEDAGDLTVYPISWKYPYGDGHTIEVTAHSSSAEDTQYITVVQSTFNITMPAHILYFEVYPSSITQQNVQPSGQTTGKSIFTVNNTHDSEDIDVYLKLNASLASMGLSCMGLEFVNSSSPGSGTLINTTLYKYCSDLSPSGLCNLWAYHDFNCTYAQLTKAYYNPIFVWESLCSSCVISQDALD